jgi:hypothetical protein
MRKYLTLAALALVLVLPTAVWAHGGVNFDRKVADEYGFRKRLRPRAAPWFMYWPYEAYFTYPAPTGVAFPPSAMVPPTGFHPHMYQGGSFAPYPTNGYGQ